MSAAAELEALDILRPGLDYARQAADGLHVPRHVRLVAQRFLRELEDPPTGYAFDANLAALPVRIAGIMKHIKGPKARKPIELEPMQVFLLANLFGWVDESGLRRYRQSFIFLPRGNAKTTLAAIIGLYMGFMEGEGGAETYSAAVTRDQATICLTTARLMAKRAPKELRDEFGIQVLSHHIEADDGATKFRALSSDKDSLDGLNIHCAICDEVASHKTGDVYDALITGCGKRAQPHLLSITTATNNLSGIGRMLYEQSKHIVEGHVQDDRFFAFLSGAESADDPWDEATWAKVNPLWGTAVDPEHIRSLAKLARNNAALEAGFMTRHLNLWVGGDNQLFTLSKWGDCADRSLNLEDFAGERCYLTLDCSSTLDLMALCYFFPASGTRPDTVFWRLSLPEQTVFESRVSAYAQWAAAGDLTVTPGAIQDYAGIELEVADAVSTYDVQAFGYDPFQATQLVANLNAELPDLKTVEYRMTTLRLSEPTKELDARIVSGAIRHPDNPVANWCMANVVGHYDARGNVYPKRERPSSKIDAAITLVMAIGLSLFEEEEGDADVIVL